MSEIVLALAKAAILVALKQPENFDLEDALDKYPQLEKNGAAFVTITVKSTHQLRGCIGSLEAHRPLYEDIIFNAKSAALHDQRFMPLQVDELDDIEVEVSLLNRPKRIFYTDSIDLQKKIVPHKDGVILQYHSKRATYLPSVWDDLPSYHDFFVSLCTKATLNADCLTLHPDIYTYQVTKYRENDAK